MEGQRRLGAQEHLLTLGRTVRALRLDRGLSQEQLAHASGIHRAVIGFIERGERDIGVSHLWPLADALGVDVRALFSESETKTAD